MSDRWQRVETIFHDALGLEPGARTDFLRRACGGDEDLRREVESLLNADEPNRSFLESSALEMQARQIADSGDDSESDLTVEPDAPAAVKRHPFFWFTAVAGAIVLVCYVFTILLVARHGAAEKSFDWTATKKGGGLFVAQIEPDSPAANVLQPGDRVISINGDERVSRLGANYKLYQIAAGNPYAIRVERSDGDVKQEREFSLVPRERSNPANWAVIFLWLAVTVPWFVTALLVGLFQPTNRAGQLYCLVGFAVALVWLNAATVTFRNLLAPAELLAT